MACNIIEVGGVINDSFTRNKYCFKSELNKKINIRGNNHVTRKLRTITYYYY